MLNRVQPGWGTSTGTAADNGSGYTYMNNDYSNKSGGLRDGNGRGDGNGVGYCGPYGVGYGNGNGHGAVTKYGRGGRMYGF